MQGQMRLLPFLGVGKDLPNGLHAVQAQGAVICGSLQMGGAEAEAPAAELQCAVQCPLCGDRHTRM